MRSQAVLAVAGFLAHVSGGLGALVADFGRSLLLDRAGVRLSLLDRLGRAGAVRSTAAVPPPTSLA